MATMEPGQLIVPHDPEESKPAGDGPSQPEQSAVPDAAPSPAPASESSAAPAQPPVEPAAALTPVPAPSPAAFEAPQPTEEPAASWQYRQTGEDPSATPPPTAQGLQWTASEFIEHEKSFGWYGLVILGGVVAAALIYLLTKDKITTGITVFAVVAFTAFAAKSKPKVQEYALNPYGLQIGQKAYAFHDFKTFSVTEEGAIASIVFMPLKRFMPPLTIYVSPDIEPQVVDFLAAYLPFETHKTDAVDSLMRRIRF